MPFHEKSRIYVASHDRADSTLRKKTLRGLIAEEDDTPPKLSRKLSKKIFSKKKDAEHTRDKIRSKVSKTAQYNNRNLLRILFSWDGTILSYVVWRAPLWVSVILYFCVRFIPSLNSMTLGRTATTGITSIGAVLSLTLVFFVNQIWIRHRAQLHASETIASTTVDCIMHARVYFTNKEVVEQLTRYLCAAQLISHTAIAPDKFQKDDYYRKINDEMQLLTEKEMLFLEGEDIKDRNTFHFVLMWAIMVIKNQFDLDNIQIHKMQKLIAMTTAVKTHIDTLFNYEYTPVPFAYIQFVIFVSALYLPLFAFIMGLSAADDDDVAKESNVDTVVNLLAVLIQNVFILGLIAVAHKLQDPFEGDDVEDVSVIDFLEFTIKSCYKIMGTNMISEFAMETDDDVTSFHKENKIQPSDVEKNK